MTRLLLGLLLLLLTGCAASPPHHTVTYYFTDPHCAGAGIQFSQFCKVDVPD